MRPVKLKMSAFGSYGGEETVDFSKMEGGIFLISGDTGAGKTTIFDGIMYALYDVTSGGKREGSMMRSQYAPPAARTYVELTFSCKGEIYRIFRNPEYERESLRKNKDGTTKMARERARAELYLPDGTLYPGTRREINEKIREIIGLDGEQFTQTAMIAQGEFLKLLLAKSEERKEIFGRIFHTRLYGRLQELLRLREKEAWQQVKQLEQALEMQKNSIRWQKGGEESGDWGDRLEQTEADSPELLTLLEELVAAGETRERQLQKEKEMLGEIRTALDEIGKEGDSAAKLENEKQRLEVWLEEQKGTLTRWEDQVKRAEEKKEKETAVLTARQVLLQKNLSGYQVLEEKQRQYQKARHTETLQRAYGELLNVQDKLWERGEREEKLAQLEAKIKELDTGEKEQKRIYGDWQEQEAACRRKTEEYEKANEAFIRAAAGFLARDLEEGSPCPVCGSLHHPAKAVLPAQTPDQETVRRLQKERKVLEEKREQIQKRLLEIGQRIAGCKEQVRQLGRQQVDPAFACERDWFLLVLKERKELLAEIRELEGQKKHWLQEVHAEEETIPLLRELAGETSLQKRREALQGEIAQTAEKEQAARREQAALQAEIELQKKELLYEKRQEAEQELKRLGKELRQLEEDVRQARTGRDAFSREFHQKVGEFQILEKKASDARRIWEEHRGSFEKQHKEGMAAWQERIREEEPRMERGLKEIYSQNEGNRLCLEHLTKNQKEYQEKKSSYEQVHHLSALANGSLSGSVKMDFESYVQRQYFRRIIERANMRLIQMTSGQFILQCRELEHLKNQGKVGLDLDVYSLVTEQVRDVKTLSGGESFLAALSMALGLADVIQSAAGGISLDTMFIDEGFGSLDDHAREQAIRVLYELAGDSRLIGIISHVTELKEQLDQQILVKKGTQGSYIL